MSNIAEKVVKHAIMTLYKQSGLISLVYDVTISAFLHWIMTRFSDLLSKWCIITVKVIIWLVIRVEWGNSGWGKFRMGWGNSGWWNFLSFYVSNWTFSPFSILLHHSFWTICWFCVEITAQKVSLKIQRFSWSHA